jgi:hypothetical protein
MSATLDEIKRLVAQGDVMVSAHGYDELADDGIFLGDVLTGLSAALVVEDYPRAGKGPSVLVLQRDEEGKPIHVVWGIPRGKSGPAVVVTAYRPDPRRWSDDFLKRKQR